MTIATGRIFLHEPGFLDIVCQFAEISVPALNATELGFARDYDDNRPSAREIDTVDKASDPASVKALTE